MQKTINTKASEVLLAALKQARQSAGLSQAELGERIQETQSWVSKAERGERRLDLIEIRLLCKAIGLSFTDFAAEIDRKLEPFDTAQTGREKE